MHLVLLTYLSWVFLGYFFLNTIKDFWKLYYGKDILDIQSIILKRIQRY